MSVHIKFSQSKLNELKNDIIEYEMVKRVLSSYYWGMMGNYFDLEKELSNKINNEGEDKKWLTYLINCGVGKLSLS
mgnify:CR=1 FL=1